jgi:hypothetical protein
MGCRYEVQRVIGAASPPLERAAEVVVDDESAGLIE